MYISLMLIFLVFHVSGALKVRYKPYEKKIVFDRHFLRKLFWVEAF